MASSTQPKALNSPNTVKSPVKEETFWEKIGTLGRKKRIKEGKFEIFTKLFNKLNVGDFVLENRITHIFNGSGKIFSFIPTSYKILR